MIHPLSRSTTYLETYVVRADNGHQSLRSYATGIFMRTTEALLLVTNWHVVTGLDPANPAVASGPAPSFMKLTVLSKDGWLTELTVPLYDPDMRPLWEEHAEGSAVDLVIYPLPLSLEKYFSFMDVQELASDAGVDEVVGKDVFILGYPFNKEELQKGFGEDCSYHLPIWKRGSIASEPFFRLGGRVLLIDSLSRPGMSGAPVLIAQDEKVIVAGSAKNADAFKRMQQGDTSALKALCELDVESLGSASKKKFKFLGIYSGVIGSTRLDQIALGKCWHVDTLRELSTNSKAGEMPYHSPPPNSYYDAILDELAGKLVRKNVNGEVIEQVSLN